MKPFITIAISLLVSVTHAQNLVPNGDFEYTSNCPDQFSGLNTVRNWYHIKRHQGTPDHFSLKCNRTGKFNKLGKSQSAYGGQSFVGLFVYGHNSREYVGIQLNRQLEKDTVYHLTFFVQASAVYGQNVSSFAAHFSRKEISGSDQFSSMPLTLEEHVGNPAEEYIANNRYKKISGTYTAKGGERYLTFGNFKRDEDTPTASNEEVDFENIPFGFILLDNVTLVKNSQLNLFTLPTYTEPVVDINTSVTHHNPFQASYTGNNVPKALRAPRRKVFSNKVMHLSKPPRKTYAKLKIDIWDRGAIDDDIIDVYHNGDLVINHLSAGRFKKGIELQLPPGKHYIKVVAINEGTVGPNTARVRIKSYGQSQTVFFGSHQKSTQIVEVVVE